jgi:hypothetical protein
MCPSTCCARLRKRSSAAGAGGPEFLSEAAATIKGVAARWWRGNTTNGPHLRGAADDHKVGTPIVRILKPRNPSAAADPAEAVAAGSAPAIVPAAPPVVAAWPGMDLLTDPISAEVLMSVWSGDAATCVPSPPGAGKTRLTTLLAAALSHRAGLRVGIAAQTRAQAIDIARRLAAVCDPTKIGLLWGRSDIKPDTGGCPLIDGGMRMWPDSGGMVRVATKAKWLYSQPDKHKADVLVVDEAFQCHYADLGALGAMAHQIVCVGDPGQIDPVVTGDTGRWASWPTGPHLPGPTALQAAHPHLVNTVALEYTWRLGPATTTFVQNRFYPGLPFTSRRPAEHISTGAGVLPELAHRTLRIANGATDAALISAAAQRVRDLLDGAELTTPAGTRRLTDEDIAVVVPHIQQAAAIRAMLSAFPGVLVGTADALQGLERHAVVAVHPLAGKRVADEFSLKPGRLCVMLSRHRAHLSVLIDDQSAAVLDAADGEPVDQAHAVLTDLLSTAPF